MTEKTTVVSRATGGLIALAIAVAPALFQWVNGRAQLQLQSQQQRDDIRRRYLDLAINPDRDPFYRQQVLRYLKKTAAENDRPLAEWATEEEARVTAQVKEIENLRRQLTERIVAYNKAQEALRSSRAEGAEARKAAADASAQVVELRERLRRAEEPWASVFLIDPVTGEMHGSAKRVKMFELPKPDAGQ